MTASHNNPYRSPQQVSTVQPSQSEAVDVGWKQIARRWEILRLLYNVIVGLAGLVTLPVLPGLTWVNAIVGIVVYGICANAMYLLGPVTEMYLNWFVDAWEGRLMPRRLAGFVRSRYITGMLFAGGCLFSVLLTLAIGLSAAFAAALPDQP